MSNCERKRAKKAKPADIKATRSEEVDGSTLRDEELTMSTERTKCYREACQIQNCYAKHRYNMSKCHRQIDLLHLCCVQVYHSHQLVPVSCPDIDKNPLYERYMKQLDKLKLK